MDTLAQLRQEYAEHADRSLDATDPLHLMNVWLEQAVATPDIYEPNAMALATADVSAAPSVRMVLVKGFNAATGALAFYTGRESRKGRELLENPRASGTMWWAPLHRQLRVTGAVVPLDQDTVDRYFASRPAGSRLSARASLQSMPMQSPDELAGALAELRMSPPDDSRAPRHWGGFEIVPDEIEFWHGRSDRAHDRVIFVRDGSPACERLEARAHAADRSTYLRSCPDAPGWSRTWLQP